VSAKALANSPFPSGTRVRIAIRNAQGWHEPAYRAIQGGTGTVTDLSGRNGEAFVTLDVPYLSFKGFWLPPADLVALSLSELSQETARLLQLDLFGGEA
jgi:hypothetical protein